MWLQSERSKTMVSAILFASFALLLIFNVPIAVALGIAGIIGMHFADVSLSQIPVMAFTASSKFSLLAIPFFVLGGNIMEKAGISEKLINFAKACVGHTRNGVAVVLVVVACFFAAISGSGPATVAALGIILIPAMVEAGYSLTYATALMSAAGAIGVIIPPSVTFVVYGCVSGASIGKLFMAGIIPGIMMGVALVLCTIICSRNNPNLKPLPKASGAERWKAFKDAFWGLMMPVIILGGIYGGIFTPTEAAAVSAVYGLFVGIFTPTEAAAVSAVYGLFVGIFIYHRIRLKEMKELIVNSASQTGVVMYVIIAATMFAYVITVDNLAITASDAMMAITGGNIYIFLLIVNIILLIAGCVMDAVSALYILVPILYPIAQRMGYDVTAFGIVMCVNLAIGLVTPPVGVNLFTGASISKITIKDMIGDVLPIIGSLLIVLLIVTYIPQVSMFLPNVTGMK